MRRTTLLAPGGLALAMLLVAVSTVSYRWVTSSRSVTAATAVERYRAEIAQGTPPPAKPGATAAPASAGPVSAHATAAPQQSSRARATTPTGAAESWWHAPASGVYTYDTTGFERATVSRNYPPQSQRIVDTTGGRFDNHHIFSQEHEEWFSLRATPRAGVMLTRRLRVTFGPVTVDDTVVFDPPLIGVPIPYRLGQKWSASWKGDTYGTYTGQTVDHRTITIAGQPVEVWVEHLTLQAHGKITGTVDTKLWWAPKLGMDAREDGVYDMRAQGVPGTYHTEYTITLASLRPQQ